jgi:N-acylneuraminate cytidylyltransferase
VIAGKRVLAIIPARGGSKGVPRKNIREVAGKPLIAWTIQESRKSCFIDRVVLSSEDPEIIEVAKAWGCEAPFFRPLDLARDDTPGIEPFLHAIQNLPGYEFGVLLQPTSPLRKAEDIDGCIRYCAESGASACVSVSKPDKSPYWMYTVDGSGRMKPVIPSSSPIDRRQDLPEVYALNGAVYVAKCEWVLKSRTFMVPETVAYPMPHERSVDIDSETDLRWCDFILSVVNARR